MPGPPCFRAAPGNIPPCKSRSPHYPMAHVQHITAPFWVPNLEFAIANTFSPVSINTYLFPLATIQPDLSPPPL
jgi:hypothetical protein